MISDNEIKKVFGIRQVSDIMSNNTVWGDLTDSSADKIPLELM